MCGARSGRCLITPPLHVPRACSAPAAVVCGDCKLIVTSHSPAHLLVAGHVHPRWTGSRPRGALQGSGSALLRTRGSRTCPRARSSRSDARSRQRGVREKHEGRQALDRRLADLVVEVRVGEHPFQHPRWARRTRVGGPRVCGAPRSCRWRAGRDRPCRLADTSDCNSVSAAFSSVGSPAASIATTPSCPPPPTATTFPALCPSVATHRPPPPPHLRAPPLRTQTWTCSGRGASLTATIRLSAGCTGGAPGSRSQTWTQDGVNRLQNNSSTISWYVRCHCTGRHTRPG